MAGWTAQSRYCSASLKNTKNSVRIATNRSARAQRQIAPKKRDAKIKSAGLDLSDGDESALEAGLWQRSAVRWQCRPEKTGLGTTAPQTFGKADRTSCPLRALQKQWNTSLLGNPANHAASGPIRCPDYRGIDYHASEFPETNTGSPFHHRHVHGANNSPTLCEP